jgi:hypothetical protein
VTEVELVLICLHKINVYKLTVETDRGGNNNRHERNRVRWIIISTVVTYLVSSGFI